MKYINFRDLCTLRKHTCRLSPIDQYQVNLDNQHHKNLHDPEIAVLQEVNARVNQDLFVLTYDNLIVQDIGYHNKIPRSFSKIQDVQFIHEPCFLLGGDTNYYHWLLNWLPRLFLYESLNLKCKIIVHQNFNSRQLKILQNIFPWVTEEYLIKNNDNNLYSQLYIPNFFLNPLHSPRAISWIRQRVYSLYWEELSAPKFSSKIYISRSDATQRKVVNEHELTDALSKLGFEKITLSNLSFIDQINAFYHAKSIISPHGAGLANLIFCNHQPNVIEITNNYYTKVFWSLGVVVGATKYGMFKGNAIIDSHPTTLHQDIEIDLHLFTNKMSEYLL